MVQKDHKSYSRIQMNLFRFKDKFSNKYSNDV